MLKPGKPDIYVTLTLVLPICIGAVRGRDQSFTCPTLFGTFTHADSCRLYWICQFGKATLATCNDGLIYNHATQTCDWNTTEICSLERGIAFRRWTTRFPFLLSTNQLFLGDKLSSSQPKGDSLIDKSGDKAQFPSIENQGADESVLDDSYRNYAQSASYETILKRWRHRHKTWKSKKASRNKKKQYLILPAPDSNVKNISFGQTTTVTSFQLPKQLRPTRKPLAIPDCDKHKCQLPHCYCDVLNIPGNLAANKTPQIVMVTWDDSINGANFNFLNRVFAKNRTNPNGCPITGTFFVSHEWTNYKMVQELYERGHEIASHSVSHKNCVKCNETVWRDEIVGEAIVAHQNAGVKRSEVVGMRAPFLAVGGDLMFQMLWNNSFLYDSSIPSPQTSPPLWPYTLDNPVPHSCYVSCPKNPYPGLWEVPMTDIIGLRNIGCSMYDACVMPDETEELTEIFWSNFLKHYDTNRAPYLLSAHTAWFWGKWKRQQALFDFMDRALQFGDVWFVSVHQALKWIQQPIPLSNLLNFQPWQCIKQ